MRALRRGRLRQEVWQAGGGFGTSLRGYHALRVTQHTGAHIEVRRGEVRTRSDIKCAVKWWGGDLLDFT